MDIVTLGAALNGSAEYVNSHFKGGSNIQIVDNPDGTQTINASGEVSSEDTVARAEIAAIKDGETLDSFGDVETALGDKADKSTTYTKAEVDTALGDKQNTISDLATIRSGAALGATAVQPETGKGLSTNDYTTAEKTKLSGIAEGAEVNEIEGIKVNNTTINPDANKVINITVPTSAADVSALPDTTKYAAALSLTINSSTFVMTGQLKDQNGDNLGTAQTIDLPLESVVVGGSYNSQTKKVVLTLQNGNTIEFSVADLVSGLQTELSASNKLNPAYINYDSTHRAVSDTEKSTWNSKQNALSSTQLDAVNSGIDSTKVAQIETNENNILSVLDANGKKNLVPIFGRIENGGCVYTYYSNGQVTVTGNKSGSLSIATLIDNAPLSEYGLSAGDTIVLVSNNTNIGTVVIFEDNQGTQDDAIFAYNETKTVTIPSGRTKWYLRLQVKPTTKGTINETAKPMVCDKKLYDIDPTVTPYAMSNAELTALSEEDRAALVELVDGGAKNIADLTSTTKTTYTTATSNGVTITRNGDIFTISGTSDTNDNIFFNIYYAGSASTKIIPPGNWVAIIEDYTGTVVNDIAVQIVAPTTSAKVYGVPIQFSLSGSESGNRLRVNLRPSTTYDGSFRLMICSKAAWDISQTYQPYRPSYQELYEKVETNKNNIYFNQNNGVKNLLNVNVDDAKANPGNTGFTWNGNTASKNNVSFTINDDRSISVSANNTSDITIFYTSTEKAYPNTHMTGCPTGGSTTTYELRTGTPVQHDYGEGVDITSDSITNVCIIVRSGYTGNLTFKPMIRLFGDDTFEPYAMSNAELTAAIQALQAQLANQ